MAGSTGLLEGRAEAALSRSRGTLPLARKVALVVAATTFVVLLLLRAPATAGRGETATGAFLGPMAAASQPPVQPLYDDATGAPLNEEARRIVARAERAEVEANAALGGEGGGGGGGGGGAAGGVLDGVPAVEIAEGKWKYVQMICAASGAKGQQRKTIVRSYAGLRFHAENYERAADELQSMGVKCTVVGGGRINMSHGDRKINIYGYSKTFGRAKGCNEKSAGLIREAFPMYEVAWSDKGY